MWCPHGVHRSGGGHRGLPGFRSASLRTATLQYIFRRVGEFSREAPMTSAADLLKPTEAAVVARVALRDVNRVIDERILPEGFLSLDGGRRVAAAGCALIAFYVDSAKRLTSEERLIA